MANKKKVTREPHTQLFNEVLEGMAYAKLSPNEWQFVMVLWRLTYGRKNMAHKESGKFTTWINAEFHRRTGLHRPHISRIKANLLKKKVIIKKKGMIGFNKHFKKWDKGCYLDRSHVTSTGITSTGTKVLPVQATTVTSTGNINAPEVLTSGQVQSLKKERKKEIPKNEHGFESFWEKYPKKNDNKVAARKAWVKHHIKGRVPLLAILDALDVDKAGVFKDASENKYLPGAGPWLNRERWLEMGDKKITKYERSEMVQKHWLLWKGGAISEEEFERRKKHIINTYKETV
jgi:phage replication O-like protein O